MRTWTIGGDPGCDLVVDVPSVSGRHCRLSESADGFLLEDLGSTNGTYVGGVAIRSPTRVARGDAITLGRSVPMPWPLPAAAPTEAQGRPSTLAFRGSSMVVGRDPDCDRPIDLPMVSGRHARISRSAVGGLIVEDLGSSNGTSVNGRRIGGPTPIDPGDLLGLGSHTLRLVEEPEPIGPPPTLEVEAQPERIVDPGRAPTWRPDDAPALAVLLLQAPVVAAVLAMAFGGRASSVATPATWGDVAGAVAALSFALGLAAVWFGASDALWAAARGPRAPAGWASTRLVRLVAIGPLALIQSALLLGVVSLSGAVRAPIGPAFGLLALASGVGLALGLAAWALARTVGATVGATIAALLSLIALMALLGGPIRSPGALEPPTRLVAAALPTRWAFEGLLLLESDRRPTTLGPAVGDGDPRPFDMAEPAFPAETRRMGVRACALALGAMLVGLLGLALAFPTAPEPDRVAPGSG